MLEFDTIAAISTPMGEGAIAIVRLSGDEALNIASKVFRGLNNKNLNEVPTHTIHYGHLVEPKTDEIVEDAVAKSKEFIEIQENDLIVITGGFPNNAKTTNFMKIEKM